jgi:MFS family permease
MTRRSVDRTFVAALLAGSLPAVFSYVGIGVAVPAIAREFAVDGHTVQWVASAYIATMMGGMLLAGALLERLGLRACLGLSATVFSLASLWAALADGFADLVAARLLMGIAGGLAQPLALVVMFEAWPARERGKATALFGVVAAAMATLAPLLAGVLIDAVSWRAVFAAPIPLALAFLLAAHRAPHRTRRRQPFDFVGLLAVHAALLALLGFDPRQPVLAPATATALLVLAGSVGVLLWRQARASAPLFDPALYRHRGFAAAAAGATLYGALLFGLGYLLPVHYQLSLGLSPTASGLWLLLPGLAVVAAIHVAGPLTDRLSSRPILVTGFLAIALGTAALGSSQLAGAIAAATGWAIFARGGMGIVYCALNTGATRVVPEALLPQVPGAINFFRILGGGIGIKAVSAFMGNEVVADGAARGFGNAFAFLALLAVAALFAAWPMRPLSAAE